VVKEDDLVFPLIFVVMEVDLEFPLIFVVEEDDLMIPFIFVVKGGVLVVSIVFVEVFSCQALQMVNLACKLHSQNQDSFLQTILPCVLLCQYKQ
jgi:hypothetical protein